MRPLLAAVLETEGYIVGGANAPSGLHRLDDTGWTHLGWRNIRAYSVAADSAAHTLYLAAGNGALRSRDSGSTWRVVTDWRVTEVLCIAVDASRAETLYIGTAYGPWSSDDGGDTWSEATTGIPSPQATFTQAIVADETMAGRVIAGTEGGLFLTEDRAEKWRQVGPRVPIRCLCQDALEPNVWLAGTDGYGLLRSDDGGRVWSVAGGTPRDGTFWAVTSEVSAGRMAAGGYRTPVWVSDDNGREWTCHSASVADRAIHALAFDPEDPGWLYAGTVGGGVITASWKDAAWRAAGLPSASVWSLHFEGVSA